MQLTRTTWVESLHICDYRRGTLINFVKGTSLNKNMSFFSPIGRHLLSFSFLRSLKSNLYTDLTVWNIAENNCVISHAQNTTAFQPNVFLTGIHPLPATNNGRSAFPSTNNYQGQLQTSQSISILFLCCSIHLQPPLTYVNIHLALVACENYES